MIKDNDEIQEEEIKEVDKKKIILVDDVSLHLDKKL